MLKQLILKTVAIAAMVACSSAALAQEQVIKIGTHEPLTGAMARAGNGQQDGIKFAVAEANEKYTGKYQFKLVTIDDESSPAKAVSAVEKLASQDVVAITGGYGSSIVGPASATAHDLGIPYITASAIAKGLTDRGFDNFFRITNFAGYAKAMVGYIKMLDKRVGVDTVSVLYDKNVSTAQMAKAVESRLQKLGMTVHMHGFAGGTTQFSSLINKIRIQDKPDVLAVPAHENGYIAILRAAKLLKPDIKAIVAGWGLVTVKMNKEFNGLMQGVAGTGFLSYPVQFTNESAKMFAQQFQQVYGHLPDYLTLYGYVPTKLMIEAIVQAADSGELTSQRIEQALYKTDQQTLLGQVKLDAAGDNPHFTQRIGQHQGDRIEIVWPESVATAPVVLPGRPW